MADADAKTAARAAALDSRRKAAERISEKKLAQQSKLNRSHASQLLQDNKFRLQWKEGVKERRRGQLSSQVDEEILKKTIQLQPDIFDFSKLDELNPLQGLDLELKEEPQLEGTRPLDMLITTNKLNTEAGKPLSVQAILAAATESDYGNGAPVPTADAKSSTKDANALSSALLSKFNKKAPVKASVYASESERQLVLGSLSSDSDPGQKMMSRTNSIDLSQDVIHSSLEAIAGKHGLADISDRLIDNMFIVGPLSRDLESLALQAQAALSETASIESKQLSPSSSNGKSSFNPFASDKILKRNSSIMKRVNDEKVEKLAPHLVYSLNALDVEIEELCFPG
jgi:hypothetical protein